MPERLLLCTDLDRTLLPNGDQQESPGVRDHFASLAADPRVCLAYVTGRHRALVEEALDDYRLPLPDFVIGDVGTTLYHVGPDKLWQEDAQWQAHIDVDWDGRSHEDLQHALRDFDELRLQEAHKQNIHKLSYYYDPRSELQELARRLKQCLARELVHARLVWSTDQAAGTGLLDVLPERASKYHAITMLQALEGFANHDTVFCGDSGNDMEVLTSAIPAVLVANSEMDIQQQALRMVASSGRGHTLYIARGNFFGMNGNYCAGILEGIAHYHPRTAAWMGLEHIT